ncbi:unnamed protein product [Sphagnum troendelagicum]|uniref:Uncharacterized protein n=1 Tax=Sphagnum troendelagicum TaxID=128251 RepID=A0ABP0TWV7_9BRYO
MPGLRYQGAAAAINRTNGAAGSTFYSGDMHLPVAAAASGLSWECLTDLRDGSSGQTMPVVVAGEPPLLPYVPSSSSPRRNPAGGGGSRPAPSQQQPLLPGAAAAAAWMRRDFGPQSSSTKQLLLNTCSAAAGVASCVAADGSSESSDDLAVMVHDFMENDCGDLVDHSDSDCGGSPGSMKLCENLQALAAAHGSLLERKLLMDVKMSVLAINENTDLMCNSVGKECKGGCTKRFVVKRLKASGYNAAVCKSRWQCSGKVPGGEYEYIDVVFDEEEESGDEESSDRYIVDIDFQAQFKIARPTQQYEAVLKSLPTVFVGTSTKLKRFLEIMSDAAKVSLKQNAMHLPPWRTLDYMSAKWFSNFERKSKDLLMSPMFTGPCSLHWRDNQLNLVSSEAKLCGEQLRRTKVSLLAEVKGSPLSSLPCGRNSRANVILKRGIL